MRYVVYPSGTMSEMKRMLLPIEHPFHLAFTIFGHKAPFLCSVSTFPACCSCVCWWPPPTERSLPAPNPASAEKDGMAPFLLVRLGKLIIKSFCQTQHSMSSTSTPKAWTDICVVHQTSPIPHLQPLPSGSGGQVPKVMLLPKVFRG